MRFFLSLPAALLMSVCVLQAQDELPQQEQLRMAEIIDGASSRLTSVSCSFVQTKELSLLKEKMVSKGTMLFRQDGAMLRWEYLSPYPYLLVISGDKIMVSTKDRTDVIDTSRNRMFKQIADIMMGSLTGKGLMSSPYFQTRMLVVDGDWVAELSPKRKELMQMFKTIRLHFDNSGKIVSLVEMIERSGDRTVIRLENVRLDLPVDEKAFAIDQPSARPQH